MKKLLLFLLISLLGCNEEVDDLTKIKDFSKKNKYFKANMMSLHYMIETDEPTQIDTSFINLIKNLNLPTSAKGCQNGIFTGKSPKDAFDFYHEVTIEIKDEQIVSVKYDEFNDEGLSKRENKPYAQQMAKGGTTPANAYDEMQKMLKERQSILEVDAITGATYSLYRFRYAVTIALIKAKMGVS